MLRPLGALLMALALIVASGLFSGCDRGEAVRLRLHVRPVSDDLPARLEIQAQVTGSQSGLHYKWFAVSGGCDPQESDTSSTTFRFADGVIRDRVSLEVWRDDRRVAQAEIDVKFDQTKADQPNDRSPMVQVEITTVPTHEVGGPDTRADIAGRVTGQIEPDDRVILYAYAYDYWHVQPVAQASHAVGADNSWSNWTHTGSSYAALVVKAGYEPRIRLDVLPRVGGAVLARTVVEGRR